MVNKSCKNCTKCCEGYLDANIYGNLISLNNPCPFIKKNIDGGCGIYEDRPENPCKMFKCGWLQDDDNSIPEWMKPSISNVIIMLKNIDNEKVIKLRQCGDITNPNVIPWFFMWALERTNNIEISLFDKTYFYGKTINKAVIENRYKG